MKTTIVGNKVRFDVPFIDDMDAFTAGLFSGCKVYRKTGEQPLLYMMPNFSYIDKEPDGTPCNPYIESDSLELRVAGEVTASNCYDSMADNPAIARQISIEYQKIVEENKRARKEAADSKSGAFIPPTPHPIQKWWGVQFNIWLYHGSCVLDTRPSPISYKRDEWTMIYVPIENIVPGPTPTWDRFMSQMKPNDRMVFKAFIWAAFEKENIGRQILYLYDQGLTGKSTVARVFSHFLSSMTTAINMDTLDTRFGYSILLGKRLMIYSDCKDPRIVQYEKLHNLTGGDQVLIEYKGMRPFSAYIYGRVVVMANIPPIINPEKLHERTRLIPIQLHPEWLEKEDKEHYKDGIFVGNNDFEKRLQAEFWHFLYNCQQAYADRCPTGREIMMYPDQEENYVAAADTVEDSFEHYLEEHFELTPGGLIQAHDMGIALLDIADRKGDHKQNSYFLSDWKHFLARKGVKTVKKGPRLYYIGIKIKGSSDMSDEFSVAIKPSKGTESDSNFTAIDMDLEGLRL